METVQGIMETWFGMSTWFGISTWFEATKLKEALSRLRTSLPRARLLIDRAECGRFKNKELAALLSQLKDTTYDAEDLLREFHDQELRHKIEDADRSRAGQLLSSSLTLARNVIHDSKTRVQETQSMLDKVVAEMEGTLNLMGLNVEPVQLMPVLFGRDKELDRVIEMLRVTIGHDSELHQVINLLGVPLARDGRSASATGKRAAVGAGNASRSRVKRLKGESSRAGAGPSVANETNCTKNVSVLAIFGIGGVGKTTLAQFIYNDARVKAHFDLRMWVCVSDPFDIKMITRQIMRCTSYITSDTAESLNDLQEQLREQLEKKRFLLVLDDVWPIPNQGWQTFSAPLMYGLEGSMILVTTRFPKIAKLVAPPTQHVQLEGLPADKFWDFFRIFAFGNRSYPRLEAIGQRIAGRLCGSPLAAKILGRLLNLELTEDHWTRIQNSELWQLPHEENEILPALQLSYLYLPPHLKRCFAFCSLFPKDYSFERDEIVDIWVSQGFVAPGRSMRLEDTGSRYLDDLRSRFLFQADPKLPKRYVMHDLIHDMAQSVSVDECFLMQDLSYENQRGMPHTVRHMSIEVDNETLSRIAGLHHLNKLHSIRFGTRFGVQISWFNQLSNILFLSLKGCELAKLPKSICELNSLRYLDISHSNVKELPQKFWRLYSLQVFDASRSGLRTIHADIKNLINLRRLALPPTASRNLAMISGLGNLSSLRNLRCFQVGNENGRGIGELKGMNQLSGTLSIKCISKVQSRAEAAKARLVDKQYLEDLTLHWREHGCAKMMSAENEVLEALRPPSRIERLKVQGFGGDISASWLKPENLPTIRSLELSGCRSLRSVSIPFPSLKLLVLENLRIEALTTFADGMPAGLTGDEHASSSSSNGIARLPLTRLTTMRLTCCYELTNLDHCLSPEYLPSIKSIELADCWGISSLPVHNFVGFFCLQDLKIHHCPSLVCPREMVLPPSLQRLSIGYCGELDKSFPGCLENLPTIRSLELFHCRRLRSLSIPCPSLELLVLHDLGIEALTTFPDGMPAGFTGDEHAGSARLPLTRLTTIHIIDCHKLTNLDQCLSPKYLPSIKSIELADCWGISSLPVHNFGGFFCLQDLKIHHCPYLVCPREMVLPPSLQQLSIRNCRELDKSFPGCLENLGSLTLLHLEVCSNVESIPLSSIDTNKLQCLVIRRCSELSSIEGPHALSSIQHVDISDCPKLTEVQQPFKKKELKPEEKEALQFVE